MVVWRTQYHSLYFAMTAHSLYANILECLQWSPSPDVLTKPAPESLSSEDVVELEQAISH